MSWHIQVPTSPQARTAWPDTWRHTRRILVGIAVIWGGFQIERVAHYSTLSLMHWLGVFALALVTLTVTVGAVQLSIGNGPPSAEAEPAQACTGLRRSLLAAGLSAVMMILTVYLSSQVLEQVLAGAPPPTSGPPGIDIALAFLLILVVLAPLAVILIGLGGLLWPLALQTVTYLTHHVPSRRDSESKHPQCDQEDRKNRRPPKPPHQEKSR